jgi:hypothetical protein
MSRKRPRNVTSTINRASVNVPNTDARAGIEVTLNPELLTLDLRS